MRQNGILHGIRQILALLLAKSRHADPPVFGEEDRILLSEDIHLLRRQPREGEHPDLVDHVLPFPRALIGLELLVE